MLKLSEVESDARIPKIVENYGKDFFVDCDDFNLYLHKNAEIIREVVCGRIKTRSGVVSKIIEMFPQENQRVLAAMSIAVFLEKIGIIGSDE
jgi:hypothetical protein